MADCYVNGVNKSDYGSCGTGFIQNPRSESFTQNSCENPTNFNSDNLEQEFRQLVNSNQDTFGNSGEFVVPANQPYIYSQNTIGANSTSTTTISLDKIRGTLSPNASDTELKAFVKQIYASDSRFAKTFEQDLGLSQEEALAFMFADMSRESAVGTGWSIGLETQAGSTNGAHAKGVFQAGITTYEGGGYGNEFNGTGLPRPSFSDFNDPAINTYAGMFRLVEAIQETRNPQTIFGEVGVDDKSSKGILTGALAHHNTGWIKDANDAGWRNNYSDQVFVMMNEYLKGDNLNNETVFWTNQLSTPAWNG
ncbi:MAG: hypothetical protein V4629_09230 [Pseudomonadota bacterium]